MIDARTHHAPAIVPGLITQAIELVGTQKEVAARLGVTDRYLRMVASRQRNSDYGMQVMLEALIDEVDSAV